MTPSPIVGHDANGSAITAAEARSSLSARGRYAGLLPGRDWTITRRGATLTIRILSDAARGLETCMAGIWVRQWPGLTVQILP